jgi:hypothetical protein
MGMHIIGDFNKNSDVPFPSTQPWVPALHVADDIMYLSNNWSDERAQWTYEKEIPQSICSGSSTTPNPAHVSRPGETTTWVSSSLRGQGAIGEMEDWSSGQEARHVGSAVVGFKQVHKRYSNPNLVNSNVVWIYGSPKRISEYDEHLEYSQPPGAPNFMVMGSLKTQSQ